MEFNSFYEKKEEIETTKFWEVFLRYKKTIILSIFLGLFIAIVISWLMPKTYKAKALLRLSLEQPRFSMFRENNFTPTAQIVDPVSSELEVIKSRTILREVASKEGLYVVPTEHIPFNFSNQEVSSGFRGGKYLLKILPSGRFIITQEKTNFRAEGKLNDPLKTDQFSFSLLGDTPKSTIETSLEIKGQDKVLRTLKKNLKAYQKGKTDIAVISMKAEDPEEAAALANAVCATYLEFSLSDQRKVASSMRKFTEEQLSEVEGSLAKDEKALMEAKEKAGTYSILTLGNMKGPASEIIKNLTALERDRANAVAGEKEAETKLLLWKKELEKGQGVYKEHKEMASLPILSNNPIVQNLKEKLSLLESEKARLLQTYTENHPDVQAITMKIDQVKSDLQEAIKEMAKAGPTASDPLYIELMTNYISTEAELKALKDRINVYDGLIKKEEARIEALPVKEAEMTRLLRKVETGRSLYTMLLSKLQEARIAEAKEVGDAKIIDEAIPPLHPISPRIPINIFLGISLGFFLGVFIAMSKETLDNSVHSLTELEKVTDSISLGVVPYIKNLRRKKQELGKSLILLTSPDTPEAEALRSLGSRLKFASFGGPLKSFFITSSVPQEGKSTIVANLAYSLAERGYKTLLVDADFRKPTLQGILGVKTGQGLSDVIFENAQLDSILVRCKHEKMFFLASGASVKNPAEIIGSPKMSAILTQSENLFDYVVFDTPPILPFTDALELGTQLDGALLVVKAGETDKKAVQESIKLLNVANIKLIGVILNGLHKGRESDYYRYRYRYYDSRAPKKRSMHKKHVEKTTQTSLEDLT